MAKIAIAELIGPSPCPATFALTPSHCPPCWPSLYHPCGWQMGCAPHVSRVTGKNCVGWSGRTRTAPVRFAEAARRFDLVSTAANTGAEAANGSLLITTGRNMLNRPIKSASGAGRGGSALSYASAHALLSIMRTRFGGERKFLAIGDYRRRGYQGSLSSGINGNGAIKL